MVKQRNHANADSNSPAFTDGFFSNLVENQRDGILVLSDNGTIRYLNDSASAMLGKPRTELTNTLFSFPFKNSEKSEIEVVNEADSKCILEIRVSNTEVDGSINHLVQLRDISDLRQSNLIHHTFYDHLTDLPNRMLFKDRLKLEIFHAQRSKKLIAVIIVNIDRFKSINEALGFNTGDRILKHVAKKLKVTFRRSDTIARIGSDEFGLILPGLDKPEVSLRLAEKLVSVINDLCVIDAHELYLSVCLGISLFPSDGDSPEMILKNASTALERAREQGRNSYQLYSSSINTTAYEIVEMEKELCKAIRNEEFEVYYQPQVSLSTRKIIGGEALLRWNSVASGLIPAQNFIALAEETGLIQSIGDWVFRDVCRQVAEWGQYFQPDTKIAVNISPSQFWKKGFLERVKAAIEETGVDPRKLSLEITENLLMKDMDSTIRDLAELKKIGLTVSIDDFGTGYSSLSYLKRFPIDVLKIDRSFVREITINQNDAEIASAIIKMAKALNMFVIAEGVENIEQLQFFRGTECDAVQGFYYSKPIPAKDFMKFLADPDVFTSVKPEEV